jgi:hypothetical protein
MKMTFQEIRIIATGPCIANQLRDVNTICRRSWYIDAHMWKIYDFKIEVVPLAYKREIEKLGNAMLLDAFDGAPYCEETSHGRVRFMGLTILQYGIRQCD